MIPYRIGQKGSKDNQRAYRKQYKNISRGKDGVVEDFKNPVYQSPERDTSLIQMTLRIDKSIYHLHHATIII